MLNKLFATIKTLISGNGFMVYEVEPENPSYPYAIITSPIVNEAGGGKDKTYTTGTIDIIIKTATSRTRGSLSKAWSIADTIKSKIKPNEQAVLDMGTAYTNSVLYLSNEIKTEQSEKKKRIIVEKLTYFFEIETN